MHAFILLYYYISFFLFFFFFFNLGNLVNGWMSICLLGEFGYLDSFFGYLCVSRDWDGYGDLNWLVGWLSGCLDGCSDGCCGLIVWWF